MLEYQLKRRGIMKYSKKEIYHLLGAEKFQKVVFF